MLSHMQVELIQGEQSLILGNDRSRATVTLRGGHARVEWREGSDRPWRSPYSLAPWLPEQYPQSPVLLQVLRGDFFCFPFGVTEGSEFPHGETANRLWTVESANKNSAVLSLRFSTMSGSVTKRIEYNAAAGALWQEHVIDGVEGQFNYGHHPILHVPGPVRAWLSTSAFQFGQVHPDGLAIAAEGEQGQLQPGGRFDSLEDVPAANGAMVSLAAHPALSQSEDLVMYSGVAAALGWNALSFPGFLWVSLRRTVDFPSTLLWLSNGGRSQAPWSGRHVGRLGIEDVCSYFHEGAHRSRLDLLGPKGIATSRRFRRNQITRLPHLQLAIPRDEPFGQVAEINYAADGGALEIRGVDGKVLIWPCPFQFAPCAGA